MVRETRPETSGHNASLKQQKKPLENSRGFFNSAILELISSRRITSLIHSVSIYNLYRKG
jgi:hypothetical protein